MTDARELIARAVAPHLNTGIAPDVVGARKAIKAIDAAGLAIVPKDAADQLAAAETRIEELETELTEAREVIRPFADFEAVHRSIYENKKDSDACVAISSNAGRASITQGHLRRASKALKDKGGEDAD